MAPVLSKLSESRRGWRSTTRTRPTKSHTPAEWDGIKPHFVRLYIEEKKRLQEVQNILAQSYQFAATSKMLKTYIARWGIGKNKSEKEVRHAYCIFRRGYKAGKQVYMTIRKKPTTLEDLKNHLTKKGINEDGLQTPSSPTPTSIVYEFKDTDAEFDEKEDLSSPFPSPKTSLHDDTHESAGDARSISAKLDTQHSDTSFSDDSDEDDKEDEEYDEDVTTRAFRKSFRRALTFSDDEMSLESSGNDLNIPEKVKRQILQHLRNFLSKTLYSVRPKSPDYSPHCQGRIILSRFADAVQRNDANEAVTWYDRGLEMMEEMIKVPNPFSILYICELMRIAIVSKDEAMPVKMLDYVTDDMASILIDHPLPLLISSVMQASDEHGPLRAQLLRFVYENAMEISSGMDGESEIAKALKQRYAVFCTQI